MDTAHSKVFKDSMVLAQGVDERAGLRLPERSELPLGAASSAVRGCRARRRETAVPMHMAILATDAATTWSAISAIASAVAAIAAVYVARRLGTLQVEITAYTVVRDEVDAFESDLMRA